jgi:hypothetical protein
MSSSTKLFASLLLFVAAFSATAAGGSSSGHTSACRDCPPITFNGPVANVLQLTEGAIESSADSGAFRPVVSVGRDSGWERRAR